MLLSYASRTIWPRSFFLSSCIAARWPDLDLTKKFDIIKEGRIKEAAISTDEVPALAAPARQAGLNRKQGRTQESKRQNRDPSYVEAPPAARRRQYFS
jgi:hypothetical protein